MSALGCDVALVDATATYAVTSGSYLQCTGLKRTGGNRPRLAMGQISSSIGLLC